MIVTVIGNGTPGGAAQVSASWAWAWAWAWARRAALRARARFIRGTYHSANKPIATPATHVQTHHRSEGGIWPRSTSSTTSATAQAAVMIAVTSWSLASSGGG